MSFAGKTLVLITILVLLGSTSAYAEAWKELLDRADSLSKAQNQDSAIVIGSLALNQAGAEFGKEDTGVALVLHRLGTYNFYKGHYDEAELLWKRALAIREKVLGLDHLEVATSLNGLSVTYIFQGKYLGAELVGKRALAIREKILGPDHPHVAASLNNLGVTCRRQGKYAEAELFHQRALTIQERILGPDHLDVVASLDGLGVVREEQGRYDEAEPLFNRALAIREKVLGPDHTDVAASMNNLAILLMLQGKYVEARKLYERVLSIDRKILGQDHPDLATDLNNLGALYCRQGKHGEAEPLFKQALAIREKTLGPEHHLVARNLHNLANVFREQGKYAEAESLYKQSLALRENVLGPDHYDLAYLLEEFTAYYRLQRDAQASLGISKRAFEIRQRNFRDNGYVLSEKDALTYSQQMRSSANNYLSCFFDAESDEAGLHRGTSDIVLASKGQVSDDIFGRRKAFVTEKDSTTLALAESLRYAKFQLSQLFVSGPGDDTTGAYRRQSDSLGNLANELEAGLARQSASFRKRRGYENVSVDRIASLLPKNSILVEYLKYDYLQLKPDSTIAHYLVVVLNGNGETVVTGLGEASTIDPLISDYREHVLRISKLDHMPLEKDREEYEMIARKLYKAVIQPVRNHMADKELVLIAPDGGLNLISFAGLIDDEGKYLIEKCPIHYLASGRDLIRLKDRGPRGQGLLAVGDPDYGATVEARVGAPGASVYVAVEEEDKYRTRNVRSGCGDLSELQVERLLHSRKEIELVTQQWTGVDSDSAVAFFGPQASEDNFKAEASGRRVVHLATHGYFLEGRCNLDVGHRRFELDREFVGENPLLLSGLLFAGSNLHGQGADSAGVEDGVLSAYEVSAMNLEGTDLVVLSACETGLGEVKQGEGVYGLRRAFQMAGARTVVSALWPVSDKTTADMMTQLYAHSKKSLPEQIRDIQLVQIRKLRSEGFADHPYNWAAFIALGDWR